MGRNIFLHRLGADEWVTDPASLTLNGMMDIAKLDWSDRILGIIGIGRDRFATRGHPIRNCRGVYHHRVRWIRGCPQALSYVGGGGRSTMRGDWRGRGQAGYGRIYRGHVGA